MTMYPPKLDDISVGRSYGDRERLLEMAFELEGDGKDLTEDEWENIDWQEQNRTAEELHDISADQRASAFQEEVMRGGRVRCSISDFVRKAIHIDQKPFVFEGQEFMTGLFDLSEQYPEGSRNQLWSCSRQVGKSTSQAAKMGALGALTPSYKGLYVAPRYDQVKVFSSQRFQSMCEQSPGMAPWVKPSKHLWQVGGREFMNGASFNFRSCYLNADNIRGITAEMLAIDEIQDIVSDAIPVIEAVQTRFPETKMNCYAGTHKTSSNVLNRRWNNSCQFEWIVPCRSCKHENLLDESVIADDAYRCSRCSEVIVMTDGRFQPMQPEFLDKCWGFRISQVMVPFLTHKDVHKVMTDPLVTRQKFYNEVLGMPYDEGSLCLTPKVITEACNDQPMWTLQQIRELSNRGVPVFGGIDYGTGTGNQPSYTVLTIGFLATNGKFQVLYMRKFVGSEAELNGQPALINALCTQAGVRWLACDWGFGADKNARLVAEMGWNRYGEDRLLLEIMYTRQALLAKWDSNAERYHVDRSKSMGMLIDHIRTEKVEFFRSEDLQPFMSDFTTIFMEYNDTTNSTKYDHDLPDDAFHSVNYAYIAMLQYNNRLVDSGLPGLPD